MILRKIFVGLIAITLVGLIFWPPHSQKQEMSYQAVWPKKERLNLTSWHHSEKSYVIVIYMGFIDWEDLEPWLNYWESQLQVKAVLLVDYGEEAQSLWEQLPQDTKLKKTFGLARFDGSILRVMPPGQLPAAYVIPAGAYAQGPFDSYDQLPISVGVFEA